MSSSIFPSLRRLDTNPSDKAPGPSSRPFSVQTAQSFVDAVGGPSSSSPPPPSGSSALITLKFTGPSLLDVVAKDNATKEPLYIIETVRDNTCIYRLDSERREAVKAATVQWPQTLSKGKGKTGRTVQLGHGRWRETEEFLKYGALGNFASRKFNIPHFPHALKWKLVPGNSYYCSTSGVKGPIAVLEGAVLSAPPRLRIYHTSLTGNGDAERTNEQQNYKGVPVLLLDYLITTALILVTEVQEWLDRPQTDNGRVRIPGSSAPAIQKWLAIIHNDPIPDSPTLSPTLTSVSMPWDARSRMSGGESVAGSSSSDPMTPSTPATSIHSFYVRRDEDIPPVPPLPQTARSRPSTLSSVHPFAAASSSTTPPATPPPAALPTPPPSGTTRNFRSPPLVPGSRPLPTPPTVPHRPTPPYHIRPWTSDGIGSSSSSDRPSSPSLPSSSGSSSSNPSAGGPLLLASSTQQQHRRSRGAPARRSMAGMANVPPPPKPPPMHGLPLPPKLANEMMGRSVSVGVASGGSSSSHSRRLSNPPFAPSGLGYSSEGNGGGGSGLQLANPDPPMHGQEEAGRSSVRLRRMTSGLQAMSLQQQQQQQSEWGSGPSSTYRAATPVHGPGGGGVMVDAGMVSAEGSRQSYAESVYEQPPPAYDAIDFSLPLVHMQSRVPR